MAENYSLGMTGMETRQYSTFYLDDRLYGIDVMQVQEVTKTLPITQIPLAPTYVHGLINLRGQIATAIGLREMFHLKAPENTTSMNVVCRGEGVLLSLLVDRIGDVVEVEEKTFEPPPDTISESIKQFMLGVYKTNGPLLSIVDTNKIIEFLTNQKMEQK